MKEALNYVSLITVKINNCLKTNSEGFSSGRSQGSEVRQMQPPSQSLLPEVQGKEAGSFRATPPSGFPETHCVDQTV